MCTVTYVPSGDRILVASNRDEKVRRTPAHAPAAYPSRHGQLLFPKDGHAGGTWIAQHSLGHGVVLLNGGFIAHKPQPPYRRSRGLVLLDIAASAAPADAAMDESLDQIEPFTTVIWQDRSLWEFRWDGAKKHLKSLDPRQPHIWSSVTLYSPEVIRKREQWFVRWLDRQSTPGLDDLLHFHQFTGDGDKQNDLFMDRDGELCTVSITGISLESGLASMSYFDTQSSVKTIYPLALQPLPSPTE